MRLATRMVSGEIWDATIAGFDEVCQEQLYAFAIGRWPSVVHEPVLFLYEGEVVGGSLIMIQPLPLKLGHIAVSKWGPMLRSAGRADAPAIHAGMIDALVADYADKRGYMLSVLPRADLNPVNVAYRSLLARGFKSAPSCFSPIAIWFRCGSATRSSARVFTRPGAASSTSRKKRASISSTPVPSGLANSRRCTPAMTDRKQFPDHSAFDSIASLMTLDDPLRPELFFVRHAGEIVAGALIFKAGDRAVYLYGATNERALPLRAGYFLHWHIIGWLRDNTPATWYDLGGTDGFQGLHQFKAGMVGDAGLIRPVPPVANYASRPLAYFAGAGAFAARDTLHSVRRTLDGWRNPKARPTQTRPSDETAP